MNKNFVTEFIAIALKEIGFDEPCLGGYYQNKLLYPATRNNCSTTAPRTYGKICGSNKHVVKAPLWSQVESWLIEKYDIYITLSPELYVGYPKGEGVNWNWQLHWYGKDYNSTDGTFMYGDNHEFPTLESARAASVIKAIEIIKNIDTIRIEHNRYVCPQCTLTKYVKKTEDITEFTCEKCGTKNKVVGLLTIKTE
jgi:hypothetical protein